MAVTPGDIGITREQVYHWLEDWKNDPQGELEDYIRQQVTKLDLDDPVVNTSGNDDLLNETHIVDMIMMDIGSYANAPSS